MHLFILSPTERRMVDDTIPWRAFGSELLLLLQADALVFLVDADKRASMHTMI